jgi:hypothetical protein
MKPYTPILVGLVVAFFVGAAFTLLRMGAGVDPGIMPAVFGAMAGVFTAFIMGNLAGNRKGVAASPEQKAAAVALTPPPGQGLLIVMREGFVGKAAGLNVVVDGRTVGQLKSPRFTALPLEPGRHELSMAFGGLAAKQNKPAVQTVTLAAGQTVAVLAKVSMGAMQNTISLNDVPPDAALSAKLKGMTMTAPEVA